MLPPGALSLIQAVPATAQFVVGAFQNRKANKLADGLQDPYYGVPQEYQRSLGNAESLAQTKYMPGYGLMQDQISADNAATTADIMQGATSGAEALSAVTNLNRNTQRTQRDIGIANAQDYQNRQAALRQQLMMMGGQREKQFDINIMQPFLRDSAAISALKNSGLHNMYQGVKGLAGAGASYFGNKLLSQDSTGGTSVFGQPVQTSVPSFTPSPVIAPNTYTGQPLTPEQLQLLQYQIQNGGQTSYSNFQ